MRPLRSRRFLAWISPRGLIIATIVFALADAGDQLVGSAFVPSAPLDETAHVLTVLFVAWAIGGAVFDRWLVPALVTTVAIDLDHLPRHFGYDFLTEGTPRPYTHSLLTIVVALVAAGLWKRRRDLLLGIAFGLVLHLWRDMAEPGTGVALLWPFSDASSSLSHLGYVAVLGLVIAVGMRRSVRQLANRQVL